jgi:hypothetical protein
LADLGTNRLAIRIPNFSNLHSQAGPPFGLKNPSCLRILWLANGVWRGCQHVKSIAPGEGRSERHHPHLGSLPH